MEIGIFRLTNIDAGDIAVINPMIDNNQLSASKADPDSWQFAVWDLAAGPKRRICELHLTGMNLTGQLDVSGLSHLNRLDRSNNQLQRLSVAGTALIDLGCHNSQLQALDLSGLSSLVKLHCAGNQLKALDVDAVDTAHQTDYVNLNQFTF